ncbi:MAG: transposase [Planctomycetales bacterium]|nr:transposase [Planctomycetales bacterium]
MLGELFDPKAEVLVHERLRPHWSQAGAIVFVTFRTVDSIPKEVLTRWDSEKQTWIVRVLGTRGSLCEPTLETNPSSSPTGHNANDSNPQDSVDCRNQQALVRGANHDYQHWSRLLPLLTDAERHPFEFHFNRCREMKLDECLGACLLKKPELAQIVADSLLHFDGDRYRMGDFVIMPNHVHLLAAFDTPERMEKQFDSWLHYTAFRINRVIGSCEHFWQQEPFDHLVRSPEQYEYLRQYIQSNPDKAGLNPGEYLYRRYY